MIYDIAAKVLPLVIQQLIENEEPLRKKKEGRVQANKADIRAIVKEVCTDKASVSLIVDVIMAAFTETTSTNKLYDLIMTDIEDRIMAATIDMDTCIYDKAMQAAPDIVRSLLPGLYSHRFNESTRICIVSHCFRDNNIIRIISARKALKDEIRDYHDFQEGENYER